MTSLIHLEAIWRYRYNKLFGELDKFIVEWDSRIKKCKCKYPECKHYQKEKWKRFGNEMEILFKQSLIMNGVSFVSSLRQVH